MTCNDCIHCNACQSQVPRSYWDSKDFYYDCKWFKEKSRYIELPCKVGDTFYCLSQYAVKGELSNKYFIDERQVSSIEYDGEITIYDYYGIDFSIDTIYFDKSKAEQKLQGVINNDKSRRSK